MISINARNQDSASVVYNFQRSSESEFRVAVDWDKSPGVNSGGYGVTFAEDRLELRGERDQNWDILVAPDGYEQSVIVTSPPDGTRSPGATPPLSKIDFPAAIKPEEARRVGLQVASALIGIPFMESMLSLPLPQSQPQSQHFHTLHGIDA